MFESRKPPSKYAIMVVSDRVALGDNHRGCKRRALP